MTWVGWSKGLCYRLDVISGQMRKVVLEELKEFVDKGSWLLFDLCGIKGKPEWLKIPSHLWSEFEDFNKMNTFASNLPVINDSAERGMALIKSYIDKVHNEEDKQDLIKVIQNF